ncbi:MAG: hypothetical protein IPK80_03155 [Nannocystis sp.]|nr:hypothetical protein [Nannocystis sp.]
MRARSSGSPASARPSPAFRPTPRPTGSAATSPRSGGRPPSTSSSRATSPTAGPEARGAIIGFTENHTRAHIYRALLEGLVYALRAGKERTEARTKVPIRTLRVAGGGSRSEVAMQITADVFGQVVARPQIAEASALGAAIVGAVGLGIHADVPSAVRAMTRPGTSFEPNADDHRTYDALFREVYQPMYGRLEPLYKRLRAITGYPP